jgi:copper chaperone CopZ
MNDIELVVGGMTCRRCVREVTSRLRDVPGVERVTAYRPVVQRGA